MKTIGLVGGLGPESTIDYYRLLIELHRATSGDRSAPPMVISSVNMEEFLDLVRTDDRKGLADRLLIEVERVARAGADFALITANTPHLVFDAVASRSPIPLLSIVEATRDFAMASGYRRLGLFGTRFTMQARFFFDVFEHAGMKLFVPDESEQNYIHQKYLDELTAGIFTEETREGILAIGRGLVARYGIEALILGGTELPLLMRDASIGVPLLDTTRIHVDRAIATLLSGKHADG